MGLFAFFGCVAIVFVVATIIGLIAAGVGCSDVQPVALSTECTSAPAMGSTNQYNDFSEVLKSVRKDYPNAYSAAGQV